MKRIGLMVGRFQPLHEGHCAIISQMIQTCETAIVCVGSANVCDHRNPFDFETRKKMLQNVFGDRLKIVQLVDLGTTQGTNDWVEYVLGKLGKISMPEPTDYFTGSVADSVWYRKRFFDYAAANPDDGEFVTSKNQRRLLHIIDRAKNEIPSASELRTFIELQQVDWEDWVPAVNHDLILDKYPQEYIIKQ